MSITYNSKMLYTIDDCSTLDYNEYMFLIKYVLENKLLSVIHKSVEADTFNFEIIFNDYYNNKKKPKVDTLDDILILTFANEEYKGLHSCFYVSLLPKNENGITVRIFNFHRFEIAEYCYSVIKIMSLMEGE